MSQHAKTAGQPDRRDLANAIRALSMDAVQAANSGHPGAPMGMADIAEVLWNDYLKHNPENPDWVDRDRFVLSNGHGSMLLYSLLHLSGYDLPIDEIRNFRQMGLSHGRASGIRTWPGRRDDDRSAGAGHRQRGRHGARRKNARGAVQSRTISPSSITRPGYSSATAASWKASRTKRVRWPERSGSAS